MPQSVVTTEALPSDNASIRSMFDRIARRYDLFNRLTSMGMDGRWRARALEAVRPGMSVLDLGCGTGDLTLAAALRAGAAGHVTGLDLSPSMLEIARRRAERPHPERAPIRLVEGRAEDVAAHGRVYDAVVSGFVLRNIRASMDEVLAGLRAALKPGAPVRLLDFTEPAGALRRSLWRTYMDRVVPLYGRLLFGRDYPDGYLSGSAASFDKPERFAARLASAGYERVSYRLFMMGSIVLYTAYAPSAERR